MYPCKTQWPHTRMVVVVCHSCTVQTCLALHTCGTSRSSLGVVCVCDWDGGVHTCVCTSTLCSIFSPLCSVFLTKDASMHPYSTAGLFSRPGMDRNVEDYPSWIKKIIILMLLLENKVKNRFCSCCQPYFLRESGVIWVNMIFLDCEGHWNFWAAFDSAWNLERQPQGSQTEEIMESIASGTRRMQNVSNAMPIQSCIFYLFTIYWLDWFYFSLP